MTSLPPGAVVHKVELPPRNPQPATCVAFGDWAAKEAEAPGLSETVRKSKREDARKAYEQAMSLDSHYLPAYLSLAQLYVSMKDHADAEATYHKAALLFPNEPRVFVEMGKCLGGDKQWDAAIAACRHAAELDPQGRPTVDQLGWMQARAGRFDDSLTTFRRLYDEGTAQYKLALMLDYLGETDQCRKHLQVAVQYPRMDEAKALLAKLDAPPAANSGVQAAAFVTSGKPSAPAAPTKGMDTVDVVVQPTQPPAKSVVLPPPPHIPIRYEEAPSLPTPAQPATPTATPDQAPLPPVPGPDLK